MIEDSTEEFHTASSGEGGSAHSSPRRHDMGALLAPVTTTPWLEDTPTTELVMMVPLRALVSRPDTCHSFE
jgi:hypothetical protein